MSQNDRSDTEDRVIAELGVTQTFVLMLAAMIGNTITVILAPLAIPGSLGWKALSPEGKITTIAVIILSYVWWLSLHFTEVVVMWTTREMMSMGIVAMVSLAVAPLAAFISVWLLRWKPRSPSNL